MDGKITEAAAPLSIFGAMKALLLTFLVLGSVRSGACQAQTVLPRHLLIGMGGGGGLTTIHSTMDTLAAGALASSAVRFNFAYALGPKWSVGGHYDRIGTVRHPGDMERVRFTTYMIEGSYRPFNGRHAALEVVAAAGYTIAALRPVDHLIPYDSRGLVAAAGIRYMHLLNETLGAFIALDHAHSAPQRVRYHDEPLVSTPDSPTSISWHSQRVTAGMFVRF
jgi:hypothetical protein